MKEFNNNNKTTPTVSIPFEVSYLPVDIGEVRIKFINTEENIVKLQSMAENAEQYVNEKAAHLLPKFDELQRKVEKSGDKADWKDIAEMLSLQKQTMALIMDEIFVPGDFEKLYKTYPDLRQIMALMPTMMTIIGEAVGISIENKDEEYKRKINQIKNKKRNKRRKR